MMATFVLSNVFALLGAFLLFLGWASSTYAYNRGRGWFIAAGICFALAVWGISDMARAADDPRKEALRLQATEFCASVKKPPAAIAEALNNAVKQDPQTWLPAILWWNRIAERYETLGCGET